MAARKHRRPLDTRQNGNARSIDNLNLCRIECRCRQSEHLREHLSALWPAGNTAEIRQCLTAEGIVSSSF